RGRARTRSTAKPCAKARRAWRRVRHRGAAAVGRGLACLRISCDNADDQRPALSRIPPAAAGTTGSSMTIPRTFSAFRIHNDDACYRSGIEQVSTEDLSRGEKLVKVAFASVSYKDALAGTGQGKMLREFPLVGGIDLAGYVVASADP